MNNVTFQNFISTFVRSEVLLLTPLLIQWTTWTMLLSLIKCVSLRCMATYAKCFVHQCYETSDSDCDADPSNVIIQNVVFNGSVYYFGSAVSPLIRFLPSFTGTSSSKDVAQLDCSPDSRCSSITVENVSTTYGKTPSESVYECENTSLLGNSASLFGSCSST